ncbi:hypothetical protein [Actinacidiphila sp. bgisy144]|uniref:hypothetical protein n=1 Tax=Actinacidiphila sp. bgisy144 TaxID=3413791 RepID=UPI003EB9D72A
MSLDIQHAAAQRMRRLIGGLVVLVVILVAGVVVLVTRGGGSPSSAPTAAPAPSAPSPSSTATPRPVATETDDGSTFLAPSTWVALPAGKATKQGLPTGFPHTVEGAAAVAVASVRAGWTWDADAAARAAAVYAVPADAAALQKAARASTANSRVSVGLPGTGALPADAQMTSSPIGVQWKNVTADRATLSVEARVVYTAGSGQPQKTQVIATTAECDWIAGDWHIKAGPGEDSPEPFDLGTAGFNSAGWRALQEGDNQ